MQELNVGLIGGGFMGKAHSLAYAAMPMFFWPAPALPVRRTVAEANADLAATAAKRFGFERSTPSNKSRWCSSTCAATAASPERRPPPYVRSPLPKPDHSYAA